MRLTTRSFVPLALFGAALACGSIPDDTLSGGRRIPSKGIIRGSVLYSGQRPCSRNGHIVGNAVVLVFDRRNPPPPKGLANTAVNLGVVTGDRLFANEPRYRADDAPYCPAQHGFDETVTASAPFEIGPLDGASYQLAAFFDSTGDFLPTFKFRNLPEQGDVGGGAIDTADALKPGNFGNPNYQPRFLPVEVGIAEPLPAGSMPGAIPTYRIPPSGYVADNVVVTIGLQLSTTRPYFYPQGLAVSFDPNSADAISTTVSDSSDAPAKQQNASALEDPNDPNLPQYLPIATFSQDLHVLAQPIAKTPPNVNHFESSFPHVRLQWAVPATRLGKPPTDADHRGELAIATDPHQPFRFQVQPFAPQGGGLLVWQNATIDPRSGRYVAQTIPEGLVPSLWPLVVLNKLVDDYAPGGSGNYHSLDPASLQAQGSPTDPVVVLQAITLLGTSDAAGPESLVNTTFYSGYFGDKTLTTPNVAKQDHVTVMLRPSVICFDSLFDAANPDKRGTLVTPWDKATTADLPAGTQDQPIVDTGALLQNPQLATLVKDVKFACLPPGRYAINAVYPDGQAWTAPNEAGACSSGEGSTDYDRLQCTGKPRDILYSQGNRAVVEIAKTTDATHCQGAQAVPDVCLPCCRRASPDPSCNCR